MKVRSSIGYLLVGMTGWGTSLILSSFFYCEIGMDIMSAMTSLSKGNWKHTWCKSFNKFSFVVALYHCLEFFFFYLCSAKASNGCIQILIHTLTPHPHFFVSTSPFFSFSSVLLFPPRPPFLLWLACLYWTSVSEDTACLCRYIVQLKWF